MARKEAASGSAANARWRTLRLSVRVLMWRTVLDVGLYAYQRVERFLLRDPRFIVASPDYGLESPSVEIDGVRHVSRAQVLQVFLPDFGRSLYQVPLSERRARLLRLDWVKDSSISRIWPNKLLVRISEREPVAFIELADPSGVARSGLIDPDGIILERPKQGAFRLPVLLGVQQKDPIAQRRDRVHRMMRLMSELGQLGDKVSEVDVADPDNLMATVRWENRAIVLKLGDHNFARRMQNFISNYPLIQQRVPNATTLDMTLEDRITVAEGNTQ